MIRRVDTLTSAPMRVGVNADGNVEPQRRGRHLPPAAAVTPVRVRNDHEPCFQLQLALVAEFRLDVLAQAQRPGAVTLVEDEVVVGVAVSDAVVRPRLVLGGHQAQQWRAAPRLLRRGGYYY